MAKTRYRFNPQTLTYEVITLPFRIRFYRFLRKVLIAFILATLANLLFSYFFHTPKLAALSGERSELMLRYGMLSDKVDASEEMLDGIARRTSNVYRAIFALDTLSVNGIYTTYPASKYTGFAEDMYAPVIKPLWMKMDDFARRLYAESVSLDGLLSMAKDKERMSEHIPAIWPIDKKLLRNLYSYGWRTDPVYGGPDFHEGMDFSGNTGTPIYSTGNGRVSKLERIRSGYGNNIIVDHGYGYKTRYAHLSKIDVVVGQEVKRGEKIGEMGNTGKSTGPHLHYEVIYLNRPVNPVSYFSREMSDEDFAAIIASAKETIFD